MLSIWEAYQAPRTAVPVASKMPGQAVGVSEAGEAVIATEWSGCNVINLGRLPGATLGFAVSINDAGQVVGYSFFPPPLVIPEPATWAMMLVDFARLGLAGYRRAKAGCETLGKAARRAPQNCV